MANLYDLDDGPRCVRAPGRAPVGTGSPARAGRRGRLHDLEAGRRARAVRRRRWRSRAASWFAATTAGSRSCSRSSSPPPWPRSWAGPASAATRSKFDFDFISGELWPGTYLWGYLFTAIAVGLMPLGLLAYERGREVAARGGALAAAAALRPDRGLAAALAGRHAHPGAGGSRAAQPAARAQRRRRAAADLAAAGRRDRRPARLLLRAVAQRPVLGARRRGQRLPALALVGHGARAAAAGCSRPRSPTGCRRPTSARWRCASGRSPGSWSSTSPPAPFPFHAFQGLTPAAGGARPCSRCAPGSASAAFPLARGRGGRAPPVRGRHGVPRQRAARGGQPRPPAVLPDRRPSATRCAISRSVPSPAAC